MSPHPVFAASSALVEAWAARRPIWATFSGVPGNDHRCDDLSPEGNADLAREYADWSERFARMEEARDPDAALALAVARDWLDQERTALAHGDPEVDLNSLSSSLQMCQMVFASMDQGSPEGWEAIAARLEGLPGALAGYRRTLARGIGRADGVAARQVRAGIAEARRHAGEESSFRALARKSASERVGRAADGACAAYAALADWLEGTMLPVARTTDGVGRDRYLREMRRFLGSVPDPEDTYAWGWEEVARIEGELSRTARELGGGSVEETIAHLDRTCVAPGREAFIDAMRERQARALSLAEGLFDIPAGVRRVDVAEATPTGHIGAYYVSPSEDLSRPGAVWYLLEGDGPQLLWREVSTAYHEGFPGHHLQIGTQVTLPALSRLHRVVYGYSGYAEGWALYAEELMGELGGYEEPAYTFGMLVNQLIRAWRVVIDIGAHLDLPIPGHAPVHAGERWSFDVGVDCLRHAGLTPARAASEMTRYLGFPAQAISYKVGQREILALRKEFLAVRGSLREFHTRVLEGGNVGLGLLRARVLPSG